MKCKFTAVVGMFTLVLGLLVLSIPQASSNAGYITIEEAVWLANMRFEGLHGDSSHVPDMVDALQKHSATIYHVTLLHALAQLDAVQALPFINELAQQGDRDAQIARARLIAEDASRLIADPSERAAVKITRFLAELQIASAQINRTVPLPFPFERGHRTAPVEVLAMREVADMVYHGEFNNYAELPEVKELDFKLDYASALKMKLAPLTHAERIDRLIRNIVQTTAKSYDIGYDQQLVVDEGLDASHAVAAQLREMDLHRDQYSYKDFDHLLDVLFGLRDRSQVALTLHFSRDPDINIARLTQHALAAQFQPGY